MKVTKKQLLRIIEMSMIKPEPVSPTIDDMIATGVPENIASDDELQIAITGDKEPYTYKMFKYERPFMQDPSFLEFLQYSMDLYIQINGKALYYEAENAESFNDFVDITWDYEDFKRAMVTRIIRLQDEGLENTPYAEQFKHTVSGEDLTGRVELSIKEIFVNSIKPYWDHWRETFGMPV